MLCSTIQINQGKRHKGWSIWFRENYIKNIKEISMNNKYHSNVKNDKQV